jgi:CRISPR/Cas system CSM-associated protein Csm4 (group 5 of RAMP superfamily)
LWGSIFKATQLRGGQFILKTFGCKKNKNEKKMKKKIHYLVLIAFSSFLFRNLHFKIYVNEIPDNYSYIDIYKS